MPTGNVIKTGLVPGTGTDIGTGNVPGIQTGIVSDIENCIVTHTGTELHIPLGLPLEKRCLDILD